MDVTARERAQWSNRTAAEMYLGLEEWVEKRRKGDEVVGVVVGIVDIPLELRETGVGRVRHVGGTMNGLEKRYAAHLELRKLTGEILDWRFEPMKLRLAPSTFFDVDFLVVAPPTDMGAGAFGADEVELHEVKGHWEDDARVKIKVAARMFPWWTFKGVMWDKARKDWKFEEFPA
jgi:hypothetical protein